MNYSYEISLFDNTTQLKGEVLPKYHFSFWASFASNINISIVVNSKYPQKLISESNVKKVSSFFTITKQKWFVKRFGGLFDTTT